MTTPTEKIAPQSQTLSRGIRMLEVLADTSRPLTIAALSEELGLHRSITYRILRTLEQHGLVVRDSNGTVSLGPRMAYLARNVASGFQTVVRPALDSISGELGVTCFLSILDQAECITLLSSEPSRATAAVVQRPGSRHSLMVGAPGLAVQSLLSAAEWDALGDEVSPRPELTEIRKQGYATSHDEVISGLSSVAVPLRVTGEAPAAIAAVFLTDAISAELVAQRLMRAAAEILPQLDTSNRAQHA